MGNLPELFYLEEGRQWRGLVTVTIISYQYGRLITLTVQPIQIYLYFVKSRSRTDFIAVLQLPLLIFLGQSEEFNSQNDHLRKSAYVTAVSTGDYFLLATRDEQ